MNQKTYVRCKDHLVSSEEFELIKVEPNGLLKTTPVPSEEKISEYYQSENYISHTDSNKTLMDRIYQFVKKISLKRKYKIIKKHHPESKTLLDIGAGTGDFLTYVNQFLDGIGIEPGEKARAIAKEKMNKVEESFDKVKGKKFDVITMWHVLEHVHDVEKQLQEINGILNENGLLIIAVPNYKSYDAKYYKSHWAAYDVPRHLWHFDQASIKTLVKRQNFNVVKILPLYFDSFYVSLLSEKIKSSKSNFIRAFFIGLLSNIKAIASGEYSSLIYVVKKGK
ncbi:class I SAM-dependent methyltransferase [Galbibacter sp. EGI 63066]|uniref:class I SAM-dependent methyltransferase n=1 Tax=Galbibacter sp. EGI 63066 TaxID=2993559 RepID=UPI0022493D9E|nr:class I SAM-dependent methyltransferase [Galbibacter sp. EGI 63066]MCX2679056.1 class I SAM-dependent methyltransferase [Galbibacter sp. EGI 63066]